MSELVPLKFYFDGEPISDQEIYRRIHAFAALLAVAKLAREHVDEWDRDFHAPGLLALLEQLDAAHPDWRTWTP